MKRENITVLEQSHLKLSKLAASQYYYQEVIIEGIKHSLFSEYQFKMSSASSASNGLHFVFSSVPNSSYGLIFVKIRALFWRKYGQNHKNTGVIRAISHKCPYIQARPYLYGRLGHTVSGQK